MEKGKYLSILSLVLLLITGCSKKKSTSGTDSVTSASPQVVLNSIEITPSPTVMLPKGKTQAFSATCKDQNGNSISGITLTWNSSDSSTVSIDASGVAAVLKDYFDITPNAEPTSKITAAAYGVCSNTVTVTSIINLEGTWQFSLTGGTTNTYNWSISQTGRTLTVGQSLSGTIAGSSVTIQGTSYPTFSGTIGSTRNSISGTYLDSDSNWGDGTWTAVKQ